MLPPQFTFSQSSLGDYAACARRFQLRYLERLRWPGIEAEPALENERYLQLGAQFHRLIHKHLLGLPLSAIAPMLTAPELRDWWEAYLAYRPKDLPTRTYPEISLSTPLQLADRQSFPLVAKFDLIAIQPGERAVIIDWKTARKRPKRLWLAGHIQTRVYRYVLVRAGAHLNGGQPLQPEQVTMGYWFANDPATVEYFPYDSDQFAADEMYLKGLVSEIQAESEWPRTEQERHCLFCQYRTLCNRGERAGTVDMLEEWALEGEFSLQDIPDVEF